MKLIYTTFPNQATAASIVEALLQKKQIKCANIFPAHTAYYMWEGKIQKEEETAALLKMDDATFNACWEALSQCHPYAIPCIIELNVNRIHPAFAHWLNP